MKSIKTVSEFDLTMCLHAFPQKFQYVNKCMGTNDISCDAGRTPDGANCSVCKGSGISVHTSAQDAVVIRMPRHKEEMIDLESMVHYEYPPIELLKFQNEYIDSLEVKCHKSVFNSQIFAQSSIANTATAEVIKLDSVYDTLTPFAEKFSDVFIHTATVSSFYVDVPDVIIIHKFPKDFKFKTLTDLLGELKLASDSSAPGYVRRELSNDIAEQQFIDKPEELQRIRTKEKFFPFPDKSGTEILYIISNGKTSLFNEVLWANFDDIFGKLEEEAAENKAYFYDYAPKKQRELLKAKVDELIAEIKNNEQPAAASFVPSEDDQQEQEAA